MRWTIPGFAVWMFLGGIALSVTLQYLFRRRNRAKLERIETELNREQAAREQAARDRDAKR